MCVRSREAAFVAGCFALCLAAAAALFAPSLGPDRAIFGRDTAAHDYGMLLWGFGEASQSGRLPLWNPWLFGGIPTLGSFALCPFYPSAILFLLLPYPLAFSAQYLFAFAVGGAGMAFLARREGLSRPAALAAALAFSLSGHFTSLAYAGHMTKALAFAWAPWAFAFARGCFASGRAAEAAGLGAAFAFMLLASHFQIAYLAALFLAVWLLAAALAARLWREPERAARLAARLAVAAALAVALGAAQVLPGLEMAPISNRAEGVPLEEAARTAYPPAEWLEYLAPGWLGSSAPNGPGPYLGGWGAPMSERIVSDYFGAAALALAGFALAAGSGSGRWLWAAIAALGLIAGSAGARARVFGADWDGEPLLAALRVALPGFDRFRSPAVAMGWTTLAGVMLAAIGLDRLLRPPAERRGKYAAALFALVAAALALVSIVCRYRAASLARTVEAMGGGEELWAALLPRKAAGYSAAILALAAALAALGQRAGPANARLRQALCAGWIALLAGDAFVKSRAYTAPPLDHADFLRYHEQSVPAALRADPRRPVRVLQKGQELTNAFMLGGVGSIHGYHPIVYRRYERLVRRYWLVGPEISALLHQNWLLWPPDETPPTGWRAAEATARGLLLQRDPPAPYAFFPERIETVSGESDAFRALEGEGFDPRRTTYAEAPTPLPARSAAPEPPVRLVQYEAGEVVFETALERPMTAVFADLMAPGWTLRRWDARGQGEEIPALVANGAIRGAVLPAGAARYEWRYEPFSFRLGLFLSLAAWSALLAFAISKAKRKPGAGDAGLETRSSK